MIDGGGDGTIALPNDPMVDAYEPAEVVVRFIGCGCLKYVDYCVGGNAMSKLVGIVQD